MIDPMVSLALSMHSSPGAYAMLLGSGTSRSAGIPTGHEITLDLIRKVARLERADAEPDPSAWYKKAHGAAANYSSVLGLLAGTQVERNALLRSYFEPTEQEAAEGVKMPRASHRAVAELMAAGYIRVVITTNFDRLLEKAAEASGVTPVVISTGDAAQGTVPLVHSKATIIKVNGDYLTRASGTLKRNSRNTTLGWRLLLTKCWTSLASWFAGGRQTGTLPCVQLSRGRQTDDSRHSGASGGRRMTQQHL